MSFNNQWNIVRENANSLILGTNCNNGTCTDQVTIPWTGATSCSKPCGNGFYNKTVTHENNTYTSSNQYPCNIMPCNQFVDFTPWRKVSENADSVTFNRTCTNSDPNIDACSQLPPTDTNVTKNWDWGWSSPCSRLCDGNGTLKKFIKHDNVTYMSDTNFPCGNRSCTSLVNFSWRKISETDDSVTVSRICTNKDISKNACSLIPNVTRTLNWTGYTNCVNGKRYKTRTVDNDIIRSTKSFACSSTPNQPINCEVGTWGDWSPCNNGTQTRNRSITTQPRNGGSPCLPLLESQSCPVDCQLSNNWSDWSVCDNGVQTRNKIISRQAMNGGEACPIVTESQSCPMPIYINYERYDPINFDLGSLPMEVNDVIIRTTQLNSNKYFNVDNTTYLNRDGTPKILLVHSDTPALFKLTRLGSGYKITLSSDPTKSFRGYKNGIILENSQDIWNFSGSNYRYNISAGPTKNLYYNDQNIYADLGFTNWSSPKELIFYKKIITPLNNIETPFNDNGGGNVIFLDRHDLNCDNKAINQFRLINNGNQYKYEAKCLAGSYNQSVGKNTDFSSNGYSDSNYRNNMIYLDRHNVDCGDNALLSRLQLVNNPAYDSIRYDYTCLPTNKNLTCRTVTTNVDDAGNGNTIYLDRQNLQCNQDEGISQFKLSRPSENQIQYSYKCCK